MPADLPLRCQCGTLQGVARDVCATYKNHVVCYCDDCQLFAFSLGCEDAILDPHGGTDVLQMSPGNLHIEQGAGKITCLRLRPKGLFRWYADCCKTPIGNTLPTNKLPYLGLVNNGMFRSVQAQELLQALGPVHLRVNIRFAKGNISGRECHERIPLTGFFPLAMKLAKWYRQGGHKQSSLFDARGKPVTEPHILSDSELQDAMFRRSRWLEN